MKLLLLGATGLVGSRALKLALSEKAFTAVIAPTRTPLAPQDKLANPVGARLEDLLPTLMSYRPDAVICALGTTQDKAGSKHAFRHVDYELPLLFANAAHAAAIETYAIVTAMGASETSRFFYYKTKGEIERAIRNIGFRSLAICRPSLIEGTRNETRSSEKTALKLLRFLAPVLPRKFHVNPAENIAAALLDAVKLAQPGCHWIYADEMA